MQCSVPFCESSSEDVSPPASTTEHIGFYAYPNSRSDLASWRRALGERGSVPAGAAVCSRRFLREDMCGEGSLRASAVPATAQVCMICLDSGSQMFSMSHYNLRKAYEHLTGQPLFDVNNLKHTLCVECAQRLTNFVKFRDKSLRSRAMMMDLVQRHKTITIQHIAALRPLKSTLAKTFLGADHCDLHLLDNSADVPEEDIREPKIELEPQMTLGSTVVQAEDSADAQADAQADEQADCSIKVKVEPEAHETCYILDDSILQDTKLLDAAMCRVLLIRMSCVEERVRAMRDPIKCEGVTLQGTEWGEFSRTTLGMGSCSAAAPRLPVSLDTDTETDTSPTSEQAFEIGGDEEVHKPSHGDNDGREILYIYGNEDRDTESEGSDYHTGDKPFACKFCNYRSCTKHNLENHVRTHTGEKPYACEVCKRKFAFKGSLVSHMRTHTGDKPFACKLCNYRSYRKHSFVNHMRTHTGEKPFTCEVCKRKFAIEPSLLKHMRTHTGEKPYVCEVCKRKFALKGNLVRHMRTHTGEKPFTCEVCKHKFAVQQSLLRHVRIHTGDKPFACNFCNYRSCTKNNLENHVRTHTGEKPYSCEVCKLKFAVQPSLLRHMRTHTGDKPYACKLCNFRSCTKYTLEIHMRTHTGEKPYACEVCKYKFAFKWSLVRHIRTQH